MAKLKFVLIIGPDTEILEPTKALASQEGFLLIGDGVRTVTLEMIESSLSGKIDSGTRIEISMHGGFTESGEYCLLWDYSNHYVFTSMQIFNLLSSLAPNAPLEVHLRSCHSAAALKDINCLSKGSVLVTYAPEDASSYSDVDSEASIDIATKIQGLQIAPENCSKLDVQLALDNIIFRMLPDTSFAISGVEGAVAFNPQYSSKEAISDALSRFYAESCQKIAELDLALDLGQLIIKPHKAQPLDHILIEDAVNWHFKIWFFKQCLLRNQGFLEFLHVNHDIATEMLTKIVGSNSIIAIAINNPYDSEIFKYLWSLAKAGGMQIAEFFNKDSPHLVLRHKLRNEILDYLLDELQEFNVGQHGVLSVEQYSMILMNMLPENENDKNNQIAIDKFFKIAAEAKVDLGLLLTAKLEIQGNEYSLLGTIAESSTATGSVINFV
jgi:hypothetical protein